MITLATLIAAGISPSIARTFLQPILDACGAYQIDTSMRQAAFVAQCGHESLGFTELEESMWYSRAETIRATFPKEVINLAVAQTLVGQPELLANTVYANRGGNGDKLSGDGFKYIGRGAIDITFRTAYMNCGLALDLDLLNHPELLIDPSNAVLSAAWYWNENNINALADSGSVAAVTRVINPPLLGFADRNSRYQACLEAFS